MDKVQKIREEVEIVVNRRLNLLNGDYFDLNKEADGFINEIMDIINSLPNEPVSDELEKVVEEIVDPTVLNAYGTKELARRLRNTICGTSVSEDLEEAIDTYLATYFGGEKEKQEWPFLKKMVIYFTNLQKEQMMAKAFPVEIDSSRSDGRCILSGNFARFGTGDKVKVIIIKED